MCGIAGFIGRFDRTVLGRMATAMAHRGPDEEGLLLEALPDGAAIGLAHRRLSIIDIATGQQPMWSRDGQAVIVFNGEIYNYRELRQKLIAAGARFQTQSDTEVIIEGWRHYGEAVVDHLDGMFAFAIWDKQRQVLFAARDRFGIKPFYWTALPIVGFAFASEIKPLLIRAGKRPVNRAGLYNYLMYGWNSADATLFDGINQLPPAHRMLVRPNQAPVIERYWSLPAPGIVPPSPEAIVAALDKAVASHLIADVPVGVALSGGLDSSAVLASMARTMPVGEIRAFTVGYGLPDDELPFARRAAGHVGVDLAERILDPAEFARSFPRFIWHLEEPLAHPVMMTTFFLARFIRERLKVVLIGEGSDELFAGYPQYRLFMPPLSAVPMTRHMAMQSFLAIANLMPPPRQLRYMLNPDMLEQAQFDQAAHRFDPYIGGGNLGDNAMRYEIEHELVHNQLARIDKLTMAHSIEARVPFLDRQFAELAAAAPLSTKLAGGVQKASLRLAMQGRLPQDIVYRPKSGKGGTQALLPMLMGMIRNGPLSDLISRETIERRGWFDSERVHRYLMEADAGLWSRHPVEARRRAKFSLALAVLEQWARLFLDGETHDFNRP